MEVLGSPSRSRLDDVELEAVDVDSGRLPFGCLLLVLAFVLPCSPCSPPKQLPFSGAVVPLPFEERSLSAHRRCPFWCNCCAVVFPAVFAVFVGVAIVVVVVVAVVDNAVDVDTAAAVAKPDDEAVDDDDDDDADDDDCEPPPTSDEAQSDAPARVASALVKLNALCLLPPPPPVLPFAVLDGLLLWLVVHAVAAATIAATFVIAVDVVVVVCCKTIAAPPPHERLSVVLDDECDVASAA